MHLNFCSFAGNPGSFGWFKAVRAVVDRRIELFVEPKWVSSNGFRPRLLTLALMVAGMCLQDQ
jgi:hypothetical protein